MSTYGHALYQLVFTTKYRGKTLQKSHGEALYKFIWGLLSVCKKTPISALHSQRKLLIYSSKLRVLLFRAP